MSELMDEYNRFMEWFKFEHPALHEKYGRNIDIPFQDGGGVSVTPRFKISQEEQDMLTYIAHSYYDKKQPEWLDTIEYIYAPDMRKDKTVEGAFRNNAHMWFSPIIKQINRQGGKVVFRFTKNAVHGVNVENVSDDIKEQAKGLLKNFEPPSPQ
jgi:hypothetical protein